MFGRALAIEPALVRRVQIVRFCIHHFEVQSLAGTVASLNWAKGTTIETLERRSERKDSLQSKLQVHR